MTSWRDVTTSCDIMAWRHIMVCNEWKKGLWDENTDQGGTTREGRQRSGVFIVILLTVLRNSMSCAREVHGVSSETTSTHPARETNCTIVGITHHKPLPKNMCHTHGWPQHGLLKIKDGANTGPYLTKAGWAWHATIYYHVSCKSLLGSLHLFCIQSLQKRPVQLQI